MPKRRRGRGFAAVLAVGLGAGGALWIANEVGNVHDAHDELWDFLQKRGALVAVGKLAADGCVVADLPTFRLNGHHRSALDGSRGPLHNTFGLDSGGRGEGPVGPVYDMKLSKGANGLARLMVGVEEDDATAPGSIHVKICSDGGTDALSDGSTRTSIEVSFPVGTSRQDEIVWAENQPPAQPSPVVSHS